MTAAYAIGTAAIGRPGYMVLGHGEDLGAMRAPVSRASLIENAERVLDAAYAGGVRHVDTARSYGIAEEIVAGWLTARGHEDVFVSTKWGYRYTAGLRADADVHEVKDHAKAHLASQWPQTRALLGDRVGLLQIHSATREGGVLQDAAVLDELARIRAAHGVRLGLSVTGPHQSDAIDDALLVLRDGAPLFSSVQATWNLLEQSAAPALLRARSAGWLVMVKEALANGRLGPRGDVRAFLGACARDGIAPDAAALASAAHQPFADVVLMGATTPAQVKSNLRAQQLDARTVARLGSLVEPEEAAAYWRARQALAWT
jgi:aryl-alcohol dehydrogenase-like predicted oxidoreductase